MSVALQNEGFVGPALGILAQPDADVVGVSVEPDLVL